MSEPSGLLASHYTLAGAAHPFSTKGVSPLPLRQRIEAAGRAGFDGYGFCGGDLRKALGELSFPDISMILQDNGLVFSELELLPAWFAPDDAMSANERSFLLDAAAQLGSRHIKVGSSGPDVPPQLIAERFATLCDEAANAGTSIALEISPLGRISSLDRGRDVVVTAGRSNGGLLLDLWHVIRGGMSLEGIAELPEGTVIFAELCDGSGLAGSDYLEDTLNLRLPCGLGVFPCEAFIDALAACGYCGPFGVEILSDEQRGLAPRSAACRAFAGADTLRRRHASPSTRQH